MKNNNISILHSIEDLDEYLYHIDRMILSLKRGGKFENLGGLIVGGMSEMKDNLVPFGHCAEEIISFHLSDKNYPICFDFPISHSLPNYAIKQGQEYSLAISEAGVCLQEA
jgi:muramoyltetrapeptide carboxypeptidase